MKSQREFELFEKRFKVSWVNFTFIDIGSFKLPLMLSWTSELKAPSVRLCPAVRGNPERPQNGVCAVLLHVTVVHCLQEGVALAKAVYRHVPLGTDRSHNRYWAFHVGTPGLYIEKGKFV